MKIYQLIVEPEREEHIARHHVSVDEVENQVTIMAKTERERPTTKQAKSRIPRFKSVEAAAEFWDTHSLADYEDELEEVSDVQFVVTRAQPKKGVTVRLEEDLLDTLRREAQAKGIGPSTLIRMWVLEHLRELRGKTA